MILGKRSTTKKKSTKSSIIDIESQRLKMKKVYLVVYETGSYSDFHYEIHKVFDDEDKAKDYIEEACREIDRDAPEVREAYKLKNAEQKAAYAATVSRLNTRLEEMYKELASFVHSIELGDKHCTEEGLGTMLANINYQMSQIVMYEKRCVEDLNFNNFFSSTYGKPEPDAFDIKEFEVE
jgi:hypothetical protein